MGDERRRRVLGSESVLDEVNQRLTDIQVTQCEQGIHISTTSEEVERTRKAIEDLIPKVVTNTNFRKALVWGMGIIGAGSIAAKAMGFY